MEVQRCPLGAEGSRGAGYAQELGRKGTNKQKKNAIMKPSEAALRGKEDHRTHVTGRCKGVH